MTAGILVPTSATIAVRDQTGLGFPLRGRRAGARSSGNVGSIISLADDRSPMGSNASGSIDPIDAGDRMGSVRLANDRSAIGADASRSGDPPDASGGLSLLGESERAHCQHNGQRNPVQFAINPSSSAQRSSTG